MLIDKANLPETDNFRKTTLFYAIYTDNVPVAGVIAAALDTDVLNRVDYYGKAPLHYTLEYGGAKMVEALLEHGANPHIKKDDKTPLLHLVNDAETAALVIAKGGNPNATDEFEQTPIHHVRNAKTATVLIENGGDPPCQR